MNNLGLIASEDKQYNSDIDDNIRLLSIELKYATERIRRIEYILSKKFDLNAPE